MRLEDVMKEGEDNALKYKVKVPDNVVQLGSTPLKEGWITLLHANGRGMFMSPDAPGTPNRKLVAVYPKSRADVLDWEVIPEAQVTELP